MEIYIILLKTRGPPCDGDESDGWNVIQTAKKKGSQRVFTACSIYCVDEDPWVLTLAKGVCWIWEIWRPPLAGSHGSSSVE